MTETCEVQYISWFLLKTNPKCFTRKFNCKAIFHSEPGIAVASPNIEILFSKGSKMIKERSPKINKCSATKITDRTVCINKYCEILNHI